MKFDPEKVHQKFTSTLFWLKSNNYNGHCILYCILSFVLFVCYVFFLTSFMSNCFMTEFVDLRNYIYYKFLCNICLNIFQSDKHFWVTLKVQACSSIIYIHTHVCMYVCSVCMYVVCVCMYIYEELQACTFSVTQKCLSDWKIFKQILQRKMKHTFVTKYIYYVNSYGSRINKRAQTHQNCYICVFPKICHYKFALNYNKSDQ